MAETLARLALLPTSDTDLLSAPELGGLEDWPVWWDAHPGMPPEEMVAGRVGNGSGDPGRARVRAARESAGRVMDACPLRAPASAGPAATAGAA